jgi:hypothetical protein
MAALPMMSYGQTRPAEPAASSFSQDEIDAAMQKMQERQKQRQTEGSNAGSKPWDRDGAYSRAQVMQRRLSDLRGLNEHITTIVSRRVPERHPGELQRLRTRAEVIRNTSLERYRDLLLDLDRQQEAATATAVKNWQDSDGPKRAVREAVAAWKRDYSIRSIAVDWTRWAKGNEIFSGSGYCEVPATVEFVTKSGHVRAREDRVTVQFYPGTGTVSVLAQIDGGESNQSYQTTDARWAIGIWEIGVRDNALVLVERGQPENMVDAKGVTTQPSDE